MPGDKLCTRRYKSNFMTPLYWWITWTAFAPHFSHVDIRSELGIISTPTSAKLIPPSTKQLGLILFSFDLSSSERGRYQQSHFTSLCCTEECLFHHPHSNGSYSPISLTPTCLSLVNQVPKSYRHSPHIISEENQLDVPLMTLNMFQPSFSITKCLPPSVARCSQPRQPIGFVTRGRRTRIYWNLPGLLSAMLPTSLLRCFSPLDIWIPNYNIHTQMANSSTHLIQLLHVKIWYGFLLYLQGYFRNTDSFILAPLCPGDSAISLVLYSIFCRLGNCVIRPFLSLLPRAVVYAAWCI